MPITHDLRPERTLAIPVAEPVFEPIFIAERAVPVVAPRQRSWFMRSVLVIEKATEWVLGVVALFIGLAILSAIPVLQILSLGYLLESSARVGRSGRLRDAFIGVRKAARVGGIVLGTWLWLWPVRFLADYAESASILDPGGRGAFLWWLGSVVLASLVALHVLFAVAVGGKLRHFFWPLNFVVVGVRIVRGGFYQSCRDAVWDFIVGLHLPNYAQLGFKGLIVGLAWLMIPATFLAVGRQPFSGAGVLAFLGVLQLGVIVMYLPFLQARLAMTNRWREGFNLAAVRRDFRFAPWAFAISLTLTLLLAMPLYLLKIEVVPREAAWLPGLVFIAFLAPARLSVGWAMGRVNRRRELGPRHWVFRWSARLVMPVASGAYVMWLFLTPYTSWNGVASFYEQHAFLLPIPLIATP
jgi:hypothetical protein